MIKNERQYRITRSQLDTFETALRGLESPDSGSDESGELLQIQRDALSSQHQELLDEIGKYERLRAGDKSLLEAESLADFPNALISGRIARGFTQKDLAERLGLKEQQIQRWESSAYATTTFARIAEVVAALGLHVREEIFVPHERFTLKTLQRNFKNIGLRSSELLKRLLPPEAFASFAPDGRDQDQAGLLFRSAVIVARVFGLPLSELLSERPPQLNLEALAIGRFKLPAKSNEETLSAYTLYAHYLAVLVEQCAMNLPAVRLPESWKEVHEALAGGACETITWKAALDYVWSLGIPVLPLQDSGAFHGAVWVIRGRPIIVVKQGFRLLARWLFDLIHELAHLVEHGCKEGLAPQFQVVEGHPISQERRESSEEEAANEFAEDVLFHGRSDEIERVCAAAARGNLRNLKNVIHDVARQEHVHPGVLANHMAFRLAQQQERWWSTASTLQASDEDPYSVARDGLLSRIKLQELNQVDREILMRACSDLVITQEDVHA